MTNVIWYILHTFQKPNNEIEYSISGEGDSPQYFYIHPTQGHITLLKSVLETEKTLYRVTILLLYNC